MEGGLCKLKIHRTKSSLCANELLLHGLFRSVFGPYLLRIMRNGGVIKKETDCKQTDLFTCYKRLKEKEKKTPKSEVQ